MAERLKLFINGQWVESKTEKYTPIYNPSTGEIQAEAPCCTKDEVEAAIAAAKAAYPGWRNTPPIKRAQIMYRVRELLIEHMEELTDSVARENGKAWAEAQGDVLKAKEGTEVACSIPTLLNGMGESLMDASSGFDTVLYREPLGVFAGIIPFNFPAMIPMGWMTPICVASGNTIVLKAASFTPMTAQKIAKLYQEAGLPDGVINIVTCSRHEAEIFLSHPDIKGISFVGSTKVGLSIYSKAATNGKRVQALCEAKNHALVLEDAPIERTAAGIINASFGCAGERCMALPVVCVQESIADELVEAIVKKAKELLAEAGYPDGFDMTITVPSNYQQHVDTAQILVEQLKQIGVNAEIQLVEWDSWLSDVYGDRKFQSTVVGVDAAYLSGRALLERFTSDASKNFINFSNEEYDKLYQQVKKSTDDEEQTELYKKMETILADDAANVYIQDMASEVALRKSYGGFTFYPLYVLDMAKIYKIK